MLRCRAERKSDQPQHIQAQFKLYGKILVIQTLYPWMMYIRDSHPPVENRDRAKAKQALVHKSIDPWSPNNHETRLNYQKKCIFTITYKRAHTYV